MSYSINLSGHSEDEEAVREAFGTLVATLHGLGNVSGQLSDQSGGIDAADYAAPADTAVAESIEPASLDGESTDDVPVADVTTGDVSTDIATPVADAPYDANDPDNPLNQVQA